MRHLSQTVAAQLAGVSRATIANRIAAGVLSKSPDGIDPAELARTFPDIGTDRIECYLTTGDVPPDTTPAADDGHLSADAAAIAAHAVWLQRLVDEQRATIERKDRELSDALRESAERDERRMAAHERQVATLTALLPAPDRSDAAPRGFFARLFSG